MAATLSCHGITKTYGRGPLAERVLSDVSAALDRGQACALLGPSGSGKTTLLSILGCLLAPTSGTVRIDGEVVDHRSGAALAEIRRARIGFVFQHAQLLPFLTLRENLRVVGRNAGLDRVALGERIAGLAESLDVARLLDRKPDAISGGQRQRIAIARAVLHRPPIILADEPTAALDWGTGEVVIRMLVDRAKSGGALLVTVTHDTRLLPYFDRIFTIEGGRLVER